jgi:hypothetical protein
MSVVQDLRQGRRAFLAKPLLESDGHMYDFMFIRAEAER